jgi:Predicted transcriptional regulator
MTTQLIKYADRLKQADRLIRLHATGSPKQFAGKLNVSLSHLYNILDELQLLGMSWAYSKTQQTYYYTVSSRLIVNIAVVPLSNDEIMSVNGGSDTNPISLNKTRIVFSHFPLSTLTA